MLRTAAVAILYVCLWAGGASAAKITLESAVAPVLITIEGELVLGDEDRFQTIVAPYSNGIVVLESKGGSLVAAMLIGRTIRLRNFTTYVASNTICASGCALAWLGGTRLVMGKDARIGFHVAYRGEDGSESGTANALMGKYLGDLGLSYDAIAYITSSAPSSMTWMTKEDAANIDIKASIVDPKDQPTAASPSLTSRAAAFVERWYSAINAPNSAGKAYLQATYANHVAYFGNSLDKSAVVERVTQFLDRWPIREYQPRKDSIKFDCRAESNACMIRGTLDFSAKSVERNEHSFGQASFEIEVNFVGGNPKVTSENGTLIARSKAPLNADASAPSRLAPTVRKDWHGKD